MNFSQEEGDVMVSDWLLNRLPDWLVIDYWRVRTWFGMHYTWCCEKCGKRGCTEDGAVDFAACLCQSCYDKQWAEYVKAVSDT